MYTDVAQAYGSCAKLTPAPATSLRDQLERVCNRLEVCLEQEQQLYGSIFGMLPPPPTPGPCVPNPNTLTYYVERAVELSERLVDRYAGYSGRV